MWKVYNFVFSSYYAERFSGGRVTESKKFDNVHCLACAKTTIMAETGELVDIRGWNFQGMCGSFLKAMHETIKAEIHEQNNLEV